MPSEMKWAISLLAGGALLWIGWKVFIVLVTLHVLICLVLMGVILLQGGEAADLAGAFGGSGSQTAFGPRAAATFLSRATTWCAIMFMFTTMALTVHVNTTSGGAAGSSVLQQFSKGAAPKPAAPTIPVAPGFPSQPVAPAAPSAPAAPPAQPAPAPGSAK